MINDLLIKYLNWEKEAYFCKTLRVDKGNKIISNGDYSFHSSSSTQKLRNEKKAYETHTDDAGLIEYFLIKL